MKHAAHSHASSSAALHHPAKAAVAPNIDHDLFKLLRKLIWWSFTVVAFYISLNMVVAAIFYNRMPLFSSYGKHNLSLLTVEQSAKLLQSDFQTQTINLEIAGVKHRFTMNDLGIKLDTKSITNELQAVKRAEQLPLVRPLILAKHQPSPNFILNQKLIEKKFEGLVKDERTDPKNAELAIRKGEVIIKDDQPGSEISAKTLAEQLVYRLNDTESFSFAAVPTDIPADIRERDLEEELKDAEKLAGAQVKLFTGDKDYEIPAKNWKNFMVIKKDKDGHTTAQISQKKLAAYIDENITPKYYVDPSPTRITEVNGRETARTEGKTGRTVDSTSISKLIAENAASGGEIRQEIKFAKVAAPVVVNNTYSRDSVGLKQLIVDFSAQYSSAKFNVAFEQLTGGGIKAYQNADESIVPASTYKAFLAAAVIHEIEAGKFTWNSATSQGSIRDCVHEMIINSTNHCSQAILNLIGWERTDEILHDYGFTATNLNNSGGGYMSTTARDEIKLFRGYYYGTLMNKTNNDYMLGLFKTQRYRTGIPTGSAPSIVADKIGFLEAWTHDTGIVYAPGNHYLLSIMTTGGSFYSIQELARRVHNLMVQ